jgi:Lrp/AsnC family leucine-responsive transcriptional regulator
MLDRIDLQIIALLQDDARIGYQELGEAVGLSAPAAYQRVRKLEESEVLTGYHAAVQPSALGWPLLAFLRVQPGPTTDRRRLEDGWAASPEVLECHLLTGAAEYLVKLRLRQLADVQAYVVSLRRGGCGVAVEIALVTPLERRAIPVG